MVRLREGRANTARGAAHFLRETVGRVRYAGARGQSRCGPTAASTPTPSSPPAAGWMSASPSPSARVLACAVSSRPYPSRTGRPSPTGWTAPPTWPKPLHSLPEQARRRAGAHRRRVKPTPGSKLALFATYSYHGFITDREGETLELEADHRATEIENAIRDLKYGVGLNHLPSGRFPERRLAGGQVIAHNGTLDGAHRTWAQIVTPRPCDASFPWPEGSPARRAASLCICPSVGPGKRSSVAPSLDSERCLSPPDGPPLTRHPQLNVPANSHQLGPRASLLILSRHLARNNHCRPIRLGACGAQSVSFGLIVIFRITLMWLDSTKRARATDHGGITSRIDPGSFR